MYLHLGGNAIIRVKDVVAILNVENRQANLDGVPGPCGTEGSRNVPAAETVKSLIITADETHPSPISSTTLRKRAIFPAGLASADPIKAEISAK